MSQGWISASCTGLIGHNGLDHGSSVFLRLQVSERLAHGLRWVLLLGWLLLIASLFFPHDELLGPMQGFVAPCLPGLACQLHDHDGNRLFWGAVVPVGLLIIVAVSHEAWRRLCPLAFLSQTFRALGWQRTVIGRSGRREVAKISQDSWIARNHLSLQWLLLVVGLALRLLVVNSHPLGLALLLLSTLFAALIVGWAFSGKAWCQYFCPMGPVQVILTGPRSALGTSAHLQNETRITQSMCRTVNQHGQEQSSCVACQTPCIDIDAERSYWQTLRGKRGLSSAWYSYPGLVLSFFLLLQWQGGGDVDYLRSGRWAYDATLAERVLTPLAQWQKAISAPIVIEDSQEPKTVGTVLRQSPPKMSDPWSRLGNKLTRTWQRKLHPRPTPPELEENSESLSESDAIPSESVNRSGPRLPADYIGGSRKPGSSF